MVISENKIGISEPLEGMAMKSHNEAIEKLCARYIVYKNEI